MSFDGSYSAVADEQLDALEAGPDPGLYNGALDACQLIFDATGVAQQRSTAITTTEGVRPRLPIVGHPPFRVFWSQSDEGPRVEAVFPHL